MISVLRLNMSKLKLISMLSLAILTAMSGNNAIAKNSFLVAPGRVQFDLEKTESKTFIITNTGDSKIRLEMSPEYIPIGKDGLNVGIHNMVGVAETENISKLVRISPQKLSLSPGERRDIRVQVRANPGAIDGDYRSHILVRMLENATTEDISGNESENGMNMKLNIKMEAAVALYARKGEKKSDLKISCEQKENEYQVSLDNKSNFKESGDILIDKITKPHVIMRNSTQTITLSPEVKGKEISILSDGENVLAKATCI